MKIFGTLREIVATVFRKNNQEITLKPNDGTYTGAVEIKLPPKLSAGAAVLVAEDVQQTLTNKVLTSPTIDTANIQSSSRLDGAEVRAIGTAVGTPSLKFYENYSSGTSSIAVQAPALSSDWTFTLPNTAGTPGTKYALANTNGDGTTSWVRYDSDNIASALVQRDVSGNFSAGTITATLSGNATNVSGTVAIGNGGTGQTTQQAALTALAGTQASGQYLRSNGTNTLLSSIQAADVPTLNQNTTGTAFNITASSNSTLTTLSSLSLPGSQVSGNISGNAANVTGTVAIGNGGTGQTTANAALNALLPSQTLAANKYLKSDGTNTTWASASGGAGEINAVLNSSGADGTTGWTGTSVVTGSNSPLNPIVTTAFSISNAATTESSTSGGYYPFTLPTGLQNRKLKVEFSYTTPATDVYKVSVYKGSTRVALTTDVSGSTSLPASVTGGKFTAYFDTDGSSSWTVSITRTSGSTGPIYVTNVIVGPGIQPQGAVVSGATSFTPSFTSSALGTLATSTAYWWREGDSIRIQGTVTAGTVTGSNLLLTLPFGTVDTTHPTGQIVGRWARNSATANARKMGDLFISSAGITTGIYFGSDDYASATNPFTALPATSLIANGDVVSFEAKVKIAEWAGSGTVQLAQNDVEYAYNTTAWGTDNTSSNFGYGPGGASITGALAGSLTQRVTFQTPIQSGDDLAVEISSDGRIWRRSDIFMDTSGNPVINSYSSAATGISSAGVYLKSISSNTTQIDVLFMRYAAMANDDSPVVDWQNGWKWRVRKSSAGAAVGFGIVQPGVSSGLVSSSGLPGNTSGLPIPTEYVGEKLNFTSRSVTGGNQTWVANASALVTLTPGTWLILGNAAFSIIGTAQAVAISTSTTAGSGQIAKMTVVQNATLNVEGQLPVAYYQVTSGTTQSLYIHGLASSTTTGTITVNGFAIRIA